MAFRTDGNQPIELDEEQRSLSVNWTRPRSLRCSTITCSRNAAFSAASWLFDLKAKSSKFSRNRRNATFAVDVR